MKLYLTLRADGDATVLTLRFSAPLEDAGRLEQKVLLTKIHDHLQTSSSVDRTYDQAGIEDHILCVRITNSLRNLTHLLLDFFVRYTNAYELEQLATSNLGPIKSRTFEVYLIDEERASFMLRNNFAYIF